METYFTIGIAILLGAIILKVAWKSLKAAIKLVCVLTLVGIALHYFAPEMLNKVVTQSQKEEVVAKVDTLKQQTEEKLVKFLGEVIKDRTQ